MRALQVVIVLPFALGAARASADSIRGSCLALSDESVAFVADTEGDAVVRVELSNGDRLRRVSLSGGPEQVLLLPDGRLVVTRRAASRVSVLDPTTLEVLDDAVVGIEPFGLALSPDGHELYVTDVQRRRFVALDSGDLSMRWAAPLRDDDARGLIVAPDGVRAYVTHLRSPRISVVDLRRRAFLFSLALPGANVGFRTGTPNRVSQVELSPNGRTLLVAMDLVDPGETEPHLICASYGCRRIDGLPPVVGALARLPLGRSARRPTAEVISVLDPTDVRWDPSGNTYWLSGIGMTGGAGVSTRYTECVVPNGRWVVSSHPLASRLRVQPRVPWLCTAGESCGDVASDAPPAPREVDLGREEDAFNRAGRHLFHVPNARISRAGLACQTCHPDGRQDGQTWASSAGRLSTPVLARRLELTAPYHWHGSARRLGDAIRETVRRLGGSGLETEEVRVLEGFVRHSLPAVPRGDTNRDHTAVEARGAELFDNLGCPQCHEPELAYQNGQRYSMGPPSETVVEPLDVPSLRLLRLGAPYLHDGRADDLGAVLDGGSMGVAAARLSRSDRTALIAFLETL